LLITFLVLSTIFLSSAYYFGSQAKNLLITEINKQLAVKGRLGELSVDPFSSFPLVNICLENLSIEESHPHYKEELMVLQRLKISFHPLKIIAGKFEVEKIGFHHGKLNVYQGKKFNNFDVLRKKNKQNKPSNKLFLACQSIALEDIELVFEDDAQNRVELAIEHSKLGLDLKEDWEIVQKTQLSLRKWHGKSQNIQKNLPILFSGKIQLQPKQKKGVLEDIALNIDQSGVLGLNGNFDYSKKKLLWELSYDSKKIAPSILLHAFSADENIPTKKIKGFLNLNGRIQNDGFHTYADTKIESKKSSFNYKSKKFFLDQLYAHHHFVNGRHQLEFRLGRLRNKGNEISGHLQYSNEQIKLDQISGRLETSFLNEMEFGILPGLAAKMEFEASGDLHKKNGQWNLDKNFVASGNCQGNFEEKSKALDLQNFDLDLKILDQSIWIDWKKGKINNSPMQANLKLKFLAVENRWDYQGKVNIDVLRLDKFYQAMTKANSKVSEEKPVKISGGLSLECGELHFDNFTAKKIKGKLFQKEQNWYWSNLAFTSCDGQILSNGSYYKKKIKAKLDLKEVDVEQLFIGMNEFGQNEIGSKNLKGNADISLDFSAQVDSSGILLPSIQAQAKLKIRNGRLYQYKTLQEISKLVDVKSLGDVKFKTLENTIEIKNQQIIFPPMNIRNDLVNLTVSGIHYFDNTVNYQVEMDVGSYWVNKSIFFKKRRERGVESTANSSKVTMKVVGTAIDPQIRVVKKEKDNKKTQVDESSLFDE